MIIFYLVKHFKRNRFNKVLFVYSHMQPKILQLTFVSNVSTGYILVFQYVQRALKIATMILLSGSHRFAEGISHQVIHLGRKG